MYIYYPIRTNKNVCLKSEFCRFVGTDSDKRLARIYISGERKIREARLEDFQAKKFSSLPSVLSLLDGLTRKKYMEREIKSIWKTLSMSFKRTYHRIHVIRIYNAIAFFPKNAPYSLIPHNTFLAVSGALPLPKSINEACFHPKWAAAIDREFRALVHRITWTYLTASVELRSVSVRWVFRPNQVDEERKQLLYKGRCNLWGDLQQIQTLYMRQWRPMKRFIHYCHSWRAVRFYWRAVIFQISTYTAKIIFHLSCISHLAPAKFLHILDITAFGKKSLYELSRARRVWNDALYDKLLH